MKKLLALAAVVGVAGAMGTASAMDRSGKVALGYQEGFTTGINNGTGGGNSLGAWSLKYGVSSNVTGQFTVGFDIADKGGNNRANFGGRLLYDLVEKENSDFYTGLGLLFDIDKDNNTLRIDVPLGMEFSFAGLPEVGFSAEVGVVWDYRLKDGAIGKRSSLSSVGGNVGGALGLGVHYYF